MRRLLQGVFVAGLALLAWSGSSRGAGYSIYEQGSKALGMAGAFTARADDPSTIFFNPAGLADLEGTQVNAGLHVIVIARDFAGINPYPGYGVTEKSPKTVGTPLNVYLAHRFSQRLAGGFGVYNPFGLKTEWNDEAEYSGRFVSTLASITPFFFTPELAFSVADGFSVGGGVSFVTSKIHLQRNVGASNLFYGDARFPGSRQQLDLGTVDIQGNGTKVGWTAGAHARLSDRIQVGGVYRSGMDIDYKDGDANFTYNFTGSGNANLDQILGQLLPANFPKSQKVSVLLPLPASAAIGVAFDPVERWTVEVDGLWTGWSRLRTVGLEFADPAISTQIEESWKDAMSLRIGAEWRQSEKLSLRGGWYFDESPQPTRAVDPLLPDANRNGLTLGAGFEVGRVHADMYGLLLLVDSRSTAGTSLRGYDGEYKSNAVIGGLNLNYKF